MLANSRSRRSRMVASAEPSRQEQNLFLNVWRQIQRVHHLRSPGACLKAEAWNIGVVATCSVADQTIQFDRQAH